MRKGGLICTLGWFALIGWVFVPILLGVFLIIAGPIIVMLGHKSIYEQGYREGYGDGKGWTKREDREPWRKQE